MVGVRFHRWAYMVFKGSAASLAPLGTHSMAGECQKRNHHVRLGQLLATVTAGDSRNATYCKHSTIGRSG